MRTNVAAPSLPRFLILAIGGVAILALAWVWIGAAYNFVLVQLVSPILPDGVALLRDNHDIEFSALLIQTGERSTVLVMHTMQMAYGLIVAISLLLAAPTISPRARTLMIIAAVLVTLLAHWVGLVLVVHRVEAMVQLAVQPEALAELGRILALVWLIVPSLIWLPVVLWSWRSREVRLLRQT